MIESLAAFCEDLCIEICRGVYLFCVVLCCVQVLEATSFLVKFESICRGSCVQSKREIFFVSLGGGGGGCTMDWGIWLIVAFVAVGFTIVALLWWVRLPKAARIVMSGQHVIITGGSSGIGLALAQLVAAEGAAVISLIARDPEKLAAAQASVQEYCKQKHSGTYHRPQVPLEVSAKPKP